MWSILGPTGIEVFLTGLSVSIRSASGNGMPPLEQVISDVNLQPGTRYQQSLVGTRRLALRLLARQRQVTLYTIRQALVNALNPDLVSDTNPIYLIYSGGQKTLRLPVVYDGGLENSDQQQIELQFLARDPVWSSTIDTTQTLTVRSSLAATDFVLERSSDGVWSELSNLGATPADAGPVDALLIATDGTIYTGGQFSSRAARWDVSNDEWVALGNLNGDVTCLAEGPDGTIYAGGSFTTPDSFIAYWNGSTWAGMGNPDIVPSAITFGNDGTLYIGGTDISSPITGTTVKSWDSGTGWTALGSGATATGGTVHSLAVENDGTLLAGGAFTGGVRWWDGSTWDVLGQGLTKTSSTPTVYALARGTDGTIFAGGDFTRADNTLVSNTARWNGQSWLPLSSGTSDVVRTLTVRPSDSLLVAGGAFTIAGGIPLPEQLAQWNGSSWFPLGLNLTPENPTNIVALAVGTGQQLVVGYGTLATATSAAITTVTNAGSAAAYPVVTLTSTTPGRVYQLINLTTGDSIAFNLLLLAGETVTLDLRPGQKSVTSSFRGNLLGTIIPGSTLATWRLQPGDNRISLFIDTADASATLTWQERHWSVDGAD